VHNYRKYGDTPFSIILIHGGPGAAGYMAPVAEKLSENYGIIEVFQTKYTINEQVEELKSVLLENGNSPFILIGHSWGAWLSFIFTVRFPDLVKKLILVACPPFEKEYSENIMEKRLARLGEDDMFLYGNLLEDLQNDDSSVNSKAFAQIGNLLNKADVFDSNSYEMSYTECNYEIFKHIWGEAAELRNSGRLFKIAKQIVCPVVAIHGDYDSHPANGVQIPLSDIIPNFRFHLLKSGS